MGSEWKTVRLHDVATLRNGAGVKQQFFAENGIPLVRVSDFTLDSIDISDCKYVEIEHAKKWASHYIESGDVIVSTVGSWPPNWSSVVGKVVRTPINVSGAIQNQNTCCILPNQAVLDNSYLFYRLKSEDFTWHTSNNAGGSANQARLPVKKLGEFQFLLPPMSVQRFIANILGTIDEKIMLNNQTNQTLEAMAQAIFKSWFVDFDPVKAKMNGEQPKGMDAATASLFPEKLVESELGLIPEGWDAGTLSDVAKYCSARTSIDSICLDNYISTENMLADRKGVTAASKLPTAKMVAAYKTGDILVSNIRPYFKKIWLAEGNGGRSNDVLGFESSVPNTDAYIMNLLYQDTFFEYMTRTSKGAKMPRGDKTAIMNWEMAVPPVELREVFSTIVDKFYKLIPQNRAQNETLESLRDTLLPKLLSGEIELDALEVGNS